MNASANLDRFNESRLARFSLLCGNLTWIIPGTALAALALALALGEQLSAPVRVAWFTLICLLQAARFQCLRHWLKHPSSYDNVERRLHIVTALAFATASSFGLFGFLAVSPDAPLTNLLIVMVLTGMVASATAGISFILPMYLAFIFPLMLPTVLRMLSFAEPSYMWIGGLMVLYLAVSLGASRNIRASILRSIELRFENSELLENLKHQHHRSEQSLAREEKANLAKSRFLAAASHDLRQPLHSLRLFTATLEMQTRDSKHKTLVNQIDSSVKSLEELFNSLLDISKLDAGTIDVDRNHIFMDGLLTQIEGEFKPLAAQKQLAFTVQLDNQVVDTDVLLLERLLRNLVGNAIRYTSSGEINISTTHDNGRVWISVSDTGIGIALADQGRVYEEFVQLGNAERDRNQGIGLGLSIVKRLADLLDVELQLDSSIGKGSTFRIGVPVGDVTLCRYSTKPVSLPSDHVASLFILVIDDDEEEVCLAIEGLLESWGCVVMCANSGDEALAQLHEIGDTPDLVVSDYRLYDGETGGDVVGRVRQALGFDLPAIILTGDIAPERLKDIQALKFPLLHKPCEPEVLHKLIAQETMPTPNLERHAS